MGTTGMVDPSLPDQVFFDADCPRCLRWTEKLRRKDPEGKKFVFHPLKGEDFESALSEEMRASLPDALVSVDGDGRVRAGGEAVLRTARRIGGLAGFLALFAGILPSAVLNSGYAWVARHRHRGKALSRPSSSENVINRFLLAFLFLLPACAGASVEETVFDSSPLMGAFGAEIDVLGLSCPKCATNVDQVLGALPGIGQVDVDLSEGLIRLRFEGLVAPSPADLAHAVKDAGFTPVEVRRLGG